jgi:hypothetical protein
MLAIMALLLSSIAVARAQESSVSMIVVFHEQAAFDGFRGAYEADEHERQHPEGRRYLNRNVLGAVQALEMALGFRADHVYSAARVCRPKVLTPVMALRRALGPLPA